jgi:flagellar basal-body rod protein FlgB
MVNIFLKTKIPLLNKALDAYSLRHKAIASNITNSTSPGYRAQGVEFEEHLHAAMDGSSLAGYQTDAHHLPIPGAAGIDGSSRVVELNAETSENGDPLASGINNVDVDREMAELAKNQIRFKYAARFIADTFRGIQTSIRGQI